MKVSASFLASDSPREAIKKINESVCDYIHVDIGDGKFIKAKNYTFGEIKSLVKSINKPLDVHLMVNNPVKYFDDYAMLNVEYITFHYESAKDVMEPINHLKDLGIKCGISIKPKTKINKIIPYLEHLDLVLIMSVEPGSSGQSFIDSTLEKVKALKEIIEKGGYKTLISVDGGVNDGNAPLLKESGTDILISDSYINKNIIENSKILKNI